MFRGESFCFSKLFFFFGIPFLKQFLKRRSHSLSQLFITSTSRLPPYSNFYISTKANQDTNRNAIKKKTRTTVDISYRKMENLPNDNSSQLSLGGVSSLNASDSRTMVWGANGSAINITKAWAGKERKPNRSSMIDDEEEVEMEKLRLCATSIRGEGKMDIGSVRKVAFENLSGGRSSRAEQRREEEV